MHLLEILIQNKISTQPTSTLKISFAPLVCYSVRKVRFLCLIKALLYKTLSLTYNQNKSYTALITEFLSMIILYLIHINAIQFGYIQKLK